MAKKRCTSASLYFFSSDIKFSLGRPYYTDRVKFPSSRRFNLFLHNDHIFLFSSLPDDHGTETRYGDCESECPCFLRHTADFCAIDAIHENKVKPRRERSA